MAKKPAKPVAKLEPVVAKGPKAAKAFPGKTKGGYSPAKLAERAAKRAAAAAA